MIRTLVIAGVLLFSSIVINAQTQAVPNSEPSRVQQKELSKTLTPKLLMSAEPNSLLKMPSAFSYTELGFFCKMEYQIERKVPLMIRLGEVKYTEALEGKGIHKPE